MLAPASTPPVMIAPETPADAARVEAVVTAAFGPGRFAKTAERLREAAEFAAGFTAMDAGRLVGSVRLWRVRIGDTPALFLGPIAVDEAFRKAGLGADLVTACLDWARSQAVAGVLLIGDLPYFGRFGFETAADVRLPGPADPRRVLWVSLSGATAIGDVAT